MPNTAEQAIYNRLASAPLFHPSTASFVENDWALEPGDVVTVNSGEDSYSVPVYSLTFDWMGSNQNGSCASTTTRVSIESTGGQTREPLPELKREQFAQDRANYSYQRTNNAKQEQEFKKYDTKFTQTDQKFSWLATESEWDELSQSGHVTAYTQLDRTARYVLDTAKKELPFAEWKEKWLIAHPEDASLPETEIRAKYNEWIAANPYAIYNTQYSDATRTERIISKTGINDLGQNETITSRVTQTADRLQSEISSTKSGVYSAVEQTLSGFRQVVSDDIAGYKSEIIQTQNTLRAEVANSLSDIYARILAWEGGSAIEVRNGNRTYKQFADPVTTLEHGANDLMVGDIWVKSNDKRTWAEAGVDQWNTSNVYEWATYRGDDVYVWKDGRWQLTVSSKDLVIQGARLEVEQDEIWAAVDDTNNGLRAEMSLTASRFYQRLTDSVNGLSSTIEQTASQIRTEVHNANSTVYSSITQTASQIRAEVSDTTNNLQSSITQTASQIRSEVSDTANNLQSSITQNANAIALRVVKGGVATQLAIEAENVSISNGNLVVDGYVRADGLYAAIAALDAVEVGTLRSRNGVYVTGGSSPGSQAVAMIDAWGSIYGTELYIGTNTMTAKNVANAIASVAEDPNPPYGKIGFIYTTLGGTTGTVNFNIADTAFYRAVGLKSEGLWVDGAKTLTLTNDNTISVSIPSDGTWSGYQPSDTLLAATVNVGGRVLNHTFNVQGSSGGTCTFAFRYSTIGTQFQVHLNGESSGLYGVLEYDDGYVYMRDSSTGYDYARVYVADLV